MYIVPSNKRIIDIFYDEVLPGITRGNLHIGEISSGIHFYTEIHSSEETEKIGEVDNDDVPTMIIKNKETFNHNLINLIQEMYDFRIPMKWKEVPPYVKSDKECLKYYLSNIWANMTYEDLNNPERYMQRYLSFLNDSTFKYKKIVTEPIDKLKGCHLEMTTIEKDITSETPYSFRIKIIDEAGKHKFVLPDIKYGIEETQAGKIAYIYSIQEDREAIKENKNDPDFAAKINRLIHSAEKDISKEELSKIRSTQTDDIGFEENIVDVTPSNILGLTAVMSLLNQSGINNVVVPSAFPIRWESVRMVNEEDLKIDSERYNYSEEKINNEREAYNLNQYKDGRNTTDKMIRNFRRLAYHFSGINISLYPFDIDDSMYVKLSDDLMPNNNDHLLAEVAQGVNDYYQKGNKTR